MRSPNVTSTRNNWIAVASAEHARRGCALPQQGFMQVGHGKEAPLKRIKPGDRISYYSPTVTLGGGFVPFRRDVIFVPAQEAPIQPLIEQFEFVENPSRWGYNFRFGLFKISNADMRLIAEAMLAELRLLDL